MNLVFSTLADLARWFLGRSQRPAPALVPVVARRPTVVRLPVERR